MPTPKTPIQFLRTRYDASTDAAVRERILRKAEHYAHTAKTRAGAQTVALLFPFPNVIAASRAVWQSRSEGADEFIDWLAGVDDWCATLTPQQTALLPVDCWPTRLARDVLNWSEGRGGASPDALRKRFIAAQNVLLAMA